MCKIRMFFLKKDRTITNDESVDLCNIKLNPIDIPSYGIWVESECITFEFGDINEVKIRFIDEKHNLSFLYGETSGRIYELDTTLRQIPETLIFSVKERLKSTSPSKRFEENIDSFLNIVNVCLDKYRRVEFGH